MATRTHTSQSVIAFRSWSASEEPSAIVAGSHRARFAPSSARHREEYTASSSKLWLMNTGTEITECQAGLDTHHARLGLCERGLVTCAESPISRPPVFLSRQNETFRRQCKSPLPCLQRFQRIPATQTPHDCRRRQAIVSHSRYYCALLRLKTVLSDALFSQWSTESRLL